MEKLSFVIPCYGSELTIKSVLDEIYFVMSQRQEYEFEIICVNDASPDNVISVLKECIATGLGVIIVDLAKNVGKASAVLAGYSLASGDYIIDLDDDGQCPMDRLWDLFSAIESGNDIVYAGYPEKKQSAFKNFGSRINSLMAYYLLGKPKNLTLTNFSIKKRFVIEEVKKYTGPYPYLPGIFLKTTSKIVNIPMEERERIAGHGNFTFRKSFALWMNGFTAFSVIPLRISSLSGLVIALTGFIYGLSIIFRKLFINPHMTMGYPSIMAALLFIGGMIMLMLGMLGEYVGRIYIAQNSLPQYVIREIYEKTDLS